MSTTTNNTWQAAAKLYLSVLSNKKAKPEEIETAVKGIMQMANVAQSHVYTMQRLNQPRIS